MSRTSDFVFRILSWFLFLYLSLHSPAQASPATDILSKIPVQYGGRIKPFQSFAYEAVLYVTGKPKFHKMNSVNLVWRWLAEPEKWSKELLLPVSHLPLQRELSPMVIHGRISPEIVLNHGPFQEKIAEAMEKRRKKEALSPLDKKRIELYERAFFFHAVGEGAIPSWFAHPDEPELGWLPLQALGGHEGVQGLDGFFSPEKIVGVKQNLAELISAYRTNSDSEESLKAAEAFSDSLRGLFESRGIVLDQNFLSLELAYNRFHPFRWAWILYLISGLLAFTAFKKINLVSLFIFLTGFAVHSCGFYLRCMIAGRPPVTNMYESIVWVSWAAILFSTVLFFIYRAPFIRVTAAFVASVALIIADSLPVVLDPSITPLVPVLRSNFWLTIHVLTITLSYGAFLLAWGIGHGVVFSFAYAPEKTELHKKLSTFLYRALQIGVILLAAGTILGGVWASFSWGRFWGWDPKETWALIALLGYLTVLHGRFTGWLGTFGIAVGSVIAFLGVLMAWYGVNFVLAAGLHSYGFGGGGFPYVTAAVAFDLLLIAYAVLKYKQKSRLIAL